MKDTHPCLAGGARARHDGTTASASSPHGAGGSSRGAARTVDAAFWFALLAASPGCDAEPAHGLDPSTTSSTSTSPTPSPTGECFPQPNRCEDGNIAIYYGYACTPDIVPCEHGCVVVGGVPKCDEPTHPCPQLFGRLPGGADPWVADCNGDPADGEEVNLGIDPGTSAPRGSANEHSAGRVCSRPKRATSRASATAARSST